MIFAQKVLAPGPGTRPKSTFRWSPLQSARGRVSSTLSGSLFFMPPALPEVFDCDFLSCLLVGGLFLFIFQTLHSGSLENHVRGHLPRFKAQGMATAGEVLIPGDEEVLAFKAVDLLGFHGLRRSITQKA